MLSKAAWKSDMYMQTVLFQRSKPGYLSPRQDSPTRDARLHDPTIACICLKDKWQSKCKDRVVAQGLLAAQPYPYTCRAEYDKSMKMLYTIGHSTRTIEEFLALLKAHDIEEVVDVRTIPKSKHNPQFGQDMLLPALNEAGIGYTHLAKLGGLRHPSRDSVNTGWQNTSFRGYADYMATDGFQEGLEELKAMAEKKRVAIMCAEAVPWRCHRSLIADALTVQGWEVLHIQSGKTAKLHELTPFLKVEDGRIVYPGG